MIARGNTEELYSALRAQYMKFIFSVFFTPFHFPKFNLDIISELKLEYHYCKFLQSEMIPGGVTVDLQGAKFNKCVERMWQLCS